MHKVYQPEFSENKIILSEEESKHAIRVMRMNVGDQLLLQDGKGTVAQAEIVDANSKRCEVEIKSKTTDSERSRRKLTVAIAPTKNISRLEWFIEKATEIGIDRIVPILCERSERKVLKVDRLNKILISAMKQSGQSFLPELAELTPVQDFIGDNPGGFVAHCEDQDSIPLFTSVISEKENLTILIGPEGDFSPDEIKFALEHNYIPVSLGNSILRTETAGIYCCSVVNAI